MLKIDIKKLKKLEQKNLKNNMKVESKLSEKQCEHINNFLLDDLGIEDQTDLAILITLLLQKGGSNKNAVNTVSVEYKKHTLQATKLLEAIKKFKTNGTVRQYARAMADIVATVALELEIEGDLANQIRLQKPEITTEEAVWCSNFQTRNPKCPESVREWLKNNLESRFRKK